MNPYRTALGAALAFGAVVAQPVAAQRVALEVRGGAVTSTGGARDRYERGWTAGGTLRLRVSERVEAYAGYQHDDYATLADDPMDEPTAAEGSNTTDDGFRAGARLHFPVSGTRVRPWGEAGVLYNRLTLDIPNATGLEFAWSPGFEAGAGIALDLAPHVALTPGVRFRYHEARFKGGADYIASGASSLTFDVGVELRP
jgi:opacity protein-like surface antigen